MVWITKSNTVFNVFLSYFTVFNLFCEMGFGYEGSVPIFDLW